MVRLATHVHVADESGTVHVFGPADEVPRWAAELITNPAAWAEHTAPADADDLSDVARMDSDSPRWPGGTPSDEWKLPELHAYAVANAIDLGDAKKKADILAAIADASSSEGAADDDSDDA